MDQSLPLNDGQKAAAEGFFKFLLGPEKEMGISGPGGVGKTFLMGHMIDEILPRYFNTCQMMGMAPEYEAVNMTATTNKAAEVLSLATGRPVDTVHSFMNLKVIDDFSTGKSKVEKTGAWKVHNKVILFVDESSMVDYDLEQFVQDGTYQSKIVWIGDHCQLAPVMESRPPVFDKQIPWFHLTQPMRTQVPELQAINQQLRDTVETGEFKPIQIVPGVIDHLNDTEMQHFIQANFKDQTLNSRILAYTNKQVIAFNDYIRDYRRLPPEWTVGEMLVNNSSIQVGKSKVRIPTEEELEIVSIGDIETMDIVPDTPFSFRKMTFKNRIGGYYQDVPVAIDKEHQDALLRWFKSQKKWERFFFLKNNFPDLRQRDASTVYKAQGSTYDSVFIDLANIATCRNADQVARQLYVAFSRARHRVFLYGELPEKFGGLIR